MATLASSVVDRIVRPFRVRTHKERLNANISNSVTSLVYTDVLGDTVGPGSFLEIGDELLYISAVTVGTNTLTIDRGVLGTTAASHTAGDFMYVNPSPLKVDVLDIINDCLVDMYPRLYQVATKDLTYSSTLIGYDLDSAVDRVLRVDVQWNSTSDEWGSIGDWRFVDNADTTVFTSGKALMLHVSLPTSARIRVVYAKPFTPLTALTQDLEADGGLQAYMARLPYYYAMARFVSQEEVKRTSIESASSHQRAQDSPAFVALQTASWYEARYQDLLESVEAQLKKETRVPILGGYGS